MKITKKDLESIRKELLAILLKYTNVKAKYPDFEKMFSIKQSSSNPDELQPFYPCVKLPTIYMYLSEDDDCIARLGYTCSMRELSMENNSFNFIEDVLEWWIDEVKLTLHLEDRGNIDTIKLKEKIPTLLKVSLSTLVEQTQVITNCVEGSFDQKLLSECNLFKLVHIYKSVTTKNTIYTYMSK